MKSSGPSIVLLAGPNGAGKTTSAPALLKGALGVTEYVNADVVAQGLAGFNPQGAAIAAGRVVLKRLDELAEKRISFAFESTLASRSFAPWIGNLVESGYEFHLVFLWLPSADLAVQRVADRVRMGGHGIPEETIRRRYTAGLRNFFRLYQPLATTWEILDNSKPAGMTLIAAGQGAIIESVNDKGLWDATSKAYGHGH
jgi:predicted ABC-type ATPase